MKFIDLRTNAIVIADENLAKEYLMDKNFRIAFDADFKESDHPRDKDGKFSSGGGGGGSAPTTKETKSKDRAQQNLDKAKYWREQAQAEKATNPERAARYEREAENFEKEGKRMMEELGGGSAQSEKSKIKAEIQRLFKKMESGDKESNRVITAQIKRLAEKHKELNSK